MPSLMQRISKFARSPQGRRLVEQAQTKARDPKTKRQIEQVRRRFAGKR